MMRQWKKPELPVRAELAFAAGIIAGACCFASGFSAAGTVTAAVFLAAAGLLLPPRIALAAAVGAVLAGAAAVHDHRSLKLDGLPDLNVYGTFRVKVTDRRITAVPGIPPPRLFSAELLSRRLTGEPEFRPLSGTVLLRLPDPEQAAPPVGSVAEVEGTLELPTHQAVRRVDGKLQIETGGMDFASYLAGRGASRSLRAEQIQMKEPPSGFDAGLCRIRDAVLERVLSQVSSDSVRRLAAALFFGVSGGLDSGSRRAFIDSGTVHLFSVSGMHVAILAGLLLWGLRLFPFRVRYPLLAGLVLLYVISTGANAPAMRAFYMIALMCLLRTLLLYTPTFNTLCLAAALLVLANPPLVFDVGFQYSFVITGVLILASQRFHDYKELAGEQLNYMLGAGRGGAAARLYRLNHLLFAVAGCTVAFLGGAAISLRMQGLLLPGSIAANLLLLPVVALLFPILFLKLALSFCGGVLNAAGAWLLTAVFDLLGAITSATAELFDRIPAVRPSLFEVWLFYLGLFLLLGVRSRRIAFSGGAVMLLLAVSWIFRANCEPPAVIAMAGGRSDIPLVAVAEPARNLAVAVNLPGGDSGAMLAELLRRRGVTELEAAYLTRPRRDAVAGLPALLRTLPVRRIVLPELDRHGWRFTDSLERYAPETPLLPSDRSGGGFCRILDQKTHFEVEYFNPGSTFKVKISVDQCDSGWRFTLRRPEAPDTVRVIAYGSVLEIWEHEF